MSSRPKYIITHKTLLVCVRNGRVMDLLHVLGAERDNHGVHWSRVMHHGARNDVVKLLTLGVNRCRLVQTKKQAVLNIDSATWPLLAKVFWFRNENMLTSLGEDGKLHRVPFVYVGYDVILLDAIAAEMLCSVVLGIDSLSPWASHVVGCLFAATTKHNMSLITMHQYETVLQRWKHSATTLQLRCVIFQVCATLHVLNKHLDFRHMDLHDGNVLVQTTPNGGKWHGAKWLVYKLEDVTFRLPNINVCSALCDFGLSIFTFGGMHAVRVEYMRGTSVKTNVVMKLDSKCYKRLMSFPHMHPGVDMHTLLKSLCNALHGEKREMVGSLIETMLPLDSDRDFTIMTPLMLLKTAFADLIVDGADDGDGIVVMIDDDDKNTIV